MPRTVRDLEIDRVRMLSQTVLPVVMSLVGVGLILGLGLNWLRERPNLDRMVITVAVAAPCVFLLAFAISRFSARGAMIATYSVGLAFMAVVSTSITLISHFNTNGLMQSMPLCCLLLVTGVFFWPSTKYFVLSLFAALTAPTLQMFWATERTNDRFLFGQLGIISIGACIAFFVLMRNVNQHANEMALEVEFRATHDGLTRIYNRMYWTEQAAAMLQQQRAVGCPVTLIFIDVDRFKQLNDTNGHAAGDAFLRHVSRALHDDFSSPHLSGRFGGDEFVVMLPGADRDQARFLIRQIQERLALSQTISSIPSLSIGMAEWNGNESLDALLHRADEQMFAQKANRTQMIVS